MQPGNFFALLDESLPFRFNFDGHAFTLRQAGAVAQTLTAAHTSELTAIK
jgi:hypothetical protein